MSEVWFNAISWSSLLLASFMIKQCAVFNSIVLATLKWDCDIKTSEILTFLPLKNNSVARGINFLLEDKLIVENIYTINFTERNKKFCLILHYNGGNRYMVKK